MHTYDAAELAGHAGTTAARVEMWTRAHIVVPADDRTPRRYTESEVRVVRAAVALGPLGVPHPALAAVADLVRSTDDETLEVVIHADGLVRFGGPRESACWVLPLAALADDAGRYALAG